MAHPYSTGWQLDRRRLERPGNDLDLPAPDLPVFLNLTTEEGNGRLCGSFDAQFARQVLIHSTSTIRQLSSCSQNARFLGGRRRYSPQRACEFKCG
jgi:hypothetical protein